jgi:hypothetical protein
MSFPLQPPSGSSLLASAGLTGSDPIDHSIARKADAFLTEAQLRLWGPLWLGVLRAGIIETWEPWGREEQTTSALRYRTATADAPGESSSLQGTWSRTRAYRNTLPYSSERRHPRAFAPTSPLIAAEDCHASLQPPCLHRGRLAF